MGGGSKSNKSAEKSAKKLAEKSNTLIEELMEKSTSKSTNKLSKKSDRKLRKRAGKKSGKQLTNRKANLSRPDIVARSYTDNLSVVPRKGRGVERLVTIIKGFRNPRAQKILREAEQKSAQFLQNISLFPQPNLPSFRSLAELFSKPDLPALSTLFGQLATAATMTSMTDSAKAAESGSESRSAASTITESAATFVAKSIVEEYISQDSLSRPFNLQGPMTVQRNMQVRPDLSGFPDPHDGDLHKDMHYSCDACDSINALFVTYPQKDSDMSEFDMSGFNALGLDELKFDAPRFGVSEFGMPETTWGGVVLQKNESIATADQSISLRRSDVDPAVAISRGDPDKKQSEYLQDFWSTRDPHVAESEGNLPGDNLPMEDAIPTKPEENIDMSVELADPDFRFPGDYKIDMDELVKKMDNGTKESASMLVPVESSDLANSVNPVFLIESIM